MNLKRMRSAPWALFCFLFRTGPIVRSKINGSNIWLMLTDGNLKHFNASKATQLRWRLGTVGVIYFSLFDLWTRTWQFPFFHSCIYVLLPNSWNPFLRSSSKCKSWTWVWWIAIKRSLSQHFNHFCTRSLFDTFGHHVIYIWYLGRWKAKQK